MALGTTADNKLPQSKPTKGRLKSMVRHSCCGFPHPAEHYGPDLVRLLMLDLEQRREAGVAVREYQDDGLRLLYYEANAADGDENSRLRASERFVREVAGNFSA